MSARLAGTLCVRGWLFTALVDHGFIDERLCARPVTHPAPRGRAWTESSHADAAAHEHLVRISEIADPTAQYAALEELTLLEAPSLTQDSFADASDRTSAIAETFGGRRLNVLVAGAGPIGLTLASALKLAMGENVNVLVVENRVAAPHRKLPYQRRWITNVPSGFLEGLVEPTILSVFKNIGNGTYIGSTINVFESLLLLSCRRLGVRFVFADDFDWSIAGGLPLHALIDATGNRLRPAATDSADDPVVVLKDVDVSELKDGELRVEKYGIRVHRTDDTRTVSIASRGRFCFPIFRGQRVRVAMLKVVHLPKRLYAPLFDYIARENADNKYYLWPGTLGDPFNQVLLMINLTKAEHDALCEAHVFPMTLAEAAESATFRRALDERTRGLVDLLAADVRQEDGASIEPPFLFDPYFLRQQRPEDFFGAPMIRVGDSMYNGNVKYGNGLSSQIHSLNIVRDLLTKYAAATGLHSGRSGR
jgi:hypothetical protein